MAHTNIERAAQELTQLFDKSKHGLFDIGLLRSLKYLRSVVTVPLAAEPSIDTDDPEIVRDILREIDHHARRYPSPTVSGKDKFTVTDKVRAIGLLIRVDDGHGQRALGQRRKAAEREVGIGIRELYGSRHLHDFLITYVVYVRDVLADPETRRQIVTEVAAVQRLRSGEGQGGWTLAGDCMQPHANDQLVPNTVPKAVSDGDRRRRWLRRTGAVATTLAVAGVLGVGINRYMLDASSADEVDVSALQARYDGKDPRGLDGADSQCADPPPSQPVLGASEPPVIGPDGVAVGHIQLRMSSACPSVIWARVIWGDGPSAMLQIPLDWTVHVIANRPATNTTVDAPEASSPGSTPYLLSRMLVATDSACVYVEVFFERNDRQARSASATTSCVLPTLK